MCMCMCVFCMRDGCLLCVCCLLEPFLVSNKCCNFIYNYIIPNTILLVYSNITGRIRNVNKKFIIYLTKIILNKKIHLRHVLTWQPVLLIKLESGYWFCIGNVMRNARKQASKLTKRNILLLPEIIWLLYTANCMRVQNVSLQVDCSPRLFGRLGLWWNKCECIYHASFRKTYTCTCTFTFYFIVSVNLLSVILYRVFFTLVIVIMINTAQEATKMFPLDAHERKIL